MVDVPNSIRTILERVKDPEIPLLNIVDMGIYRGAERTAQGWRVFITPTYTGCPAMDTIEKDLKSAFNRAGIALEVETVISPPWTTDWMSSEAHAKLKASGIAPPVGKSADKRSLMNVSVEVPCPHCGSRSTRMISNFGSTACKALYQCNDCGDPFDYFKCL